MNNKSIQFALTTTPITKKNSSQIVMNQKTGRPYIIPSKAYKNFEKTVGWMIPSEYRNLLIDYPVNVQCVYYMPTRRKVDLVNLQEATLDVLVKYGVLADDNSDIVISMDGSRVLRDKDNPRTEIIIDSLA